MNIFQAIFLGFIQGVTEFLPISSSGHLVIFEHFLGLSGTPLEFDVFLHLGTGIAVLVYFKEDWLRMMRNLLKIHKKEKNGGRIEIVNIIIGTIPAILIGISIDDIVENHLRNPWIVVWTLILVSIFMLLAEKYSKKIKEYSDINAKNSLIVGISQAIALVPGVSRSGITMTTGLFLGFNRVAAAKFSFLLSAPIIFGAGFYEMLKLYFTGFHTVTPMYFVGFISALISGYFSIAFLMKFLQTRTFMPFVYYRIILAIVVSIALITKG